MDFPLAGYKPEVSDMVPLNRVVNPFPQSHCQTHCAKNHDHLPWIKMYLAGVARWGHWMAEFYYALTQLSRKKKT